MENVPSSQEALIKTIIGLGMKVHRELGMGFLEAIYANALAFEWAESGFSFEREKRIPVFIETTSWGISLLISSSRKLS
jgi:GxxExxY protein